MLKKINAITLVAVITSILTYLFSIGLTKIPLFTKFFPYNMIGIVIIAIILKKKLIFFKKNGEYGNFGLIILTLLSHFSGLSVGREGVAIKIGYNVGKYQGLLKNNNFDPDTKYLLKSAGMSAGFSCLFGTPLAAAFFATEKTEKKYILFNIYTALIGYLISILLKMHHFHFNLDATQKFYIIDVLTISVLCLIFSLFYSILKKKIKKFTNRNIFNYIIILFFVIILMLLTDGRYQSLGTNLIDLSYLTPESILNRDAFYKLLLTAMCVGLGFFGGEVTPLFAIGSTLGTELSRYMPTSPLLLSGLGLVGIFSGASKTLIAPILMGIELFGYRYWYLFVIVCTITYFIKSDYSMYEKDEFK